MKHVNNKTISARNKKEITRKQFFNIPGRKNYSDFCTDSQIKKGLEDIDKSSKDVSELLNKVEILITNFGSRNK